MGLIPRHEQLIRLALAQESMSIVLHFLAWLLVLQRAAGIRLYVSLQDAKTNLTVDDMKVLLHGLLKNPINYESLEALTSIECLGWHGLIESGCALWDVKTYERVRAFVLENRHRQSLFLNPECCSRLGFLSGRDYSTNLKDGLLCAIPSHLNHNTIGAYISAMHYIVELDPHGIWRRRRKLKYYDWDVILDMRQQLLTTPLHQYFDFDMIEAAKGHECATIELFANYALSNIDHQDSIAASITAIMACFFFDRNSSPNESTSTKISNWALTAFQLMKRKIIKGPLARVLDWLTVTPFDSLIITGLPPIFNIDSSPALIRMGIYLAMNSARCDDSELENVALYSRQLSPRLSDYEFLQMIRMITKFSSPSKLCKIFVDGASVRLLDISPDLIGDDTTIYACFEGDGRIQYFRRWERKFSAPDYQDPDFRSLHYATVDWFSILPLHIGGIKSERALPKVLQGYLDELHPYLHFFETVIDINHYAIQPSVCERAFYKVLVMLSVFALLKLHSSAAMELHPRWISDIVCGTGDHIITSTLATRRLLVSALTTIYGYVDCDVPYMG